MVSTIRATVIDCADTATMAEFWSHALGAPVDPGPSADFASIGLPSAPLLFVRVSENKTAKNRVHFDLTAPDLVAETARLVALGARRLTDMTEDGHHWITLSDPEGNEFDLFPGH